MGDVYSLEGKQLRIGETSGFDPVGASFDGDMSVADLWTEWVKVDTIAARAALEFLWTGDGAKGTFIVEGSLRGPAVDLELSGITQPNLETFTGSLVAADLREEDIGVSLINISGIAFPFIRGKYTRLLGADPITLNARIHIKQR